MNVLCSFYLKNTICPDFIWPPCMLVSTWKACHFIDCWHLHCVHLACLHFLPFYLPACMSSSCMLAIYLTAGTCTACILPSFISCLFTYTCLPVILLHARHLFDCRHLHCLHLACLHLLPFYLPASPSSCMLATDVAFILRNFLPPPCMYHAWSFIIIM